jgi:hypothetical protein
MLQRPDEGRHTRPDGHRGDSPPGQHRQDGGKEAPALGRSKDGPSTPGWHASASTQEPSRLPHAASFPHPTHEALQRFIRVDPSV